MTIHNLEIFRECDPSNITKESWSFSFTLGVHIRSIARRQNMRYGAHSNSQRKESFTGCFLSKENIKIRKGKLYFPPENTISDP
jgi:hypothetical protein